MQSDLDFLKKLDAILPYRDTPEDLESRAKQWHQIDVNGNGYVSLAEVEKGLRDVIKIPEIFDTKPVIMRAFMFAKNALPTKTTHGDDYVTKAEYKYLLRSLRQYYQFWVAFKEIDKNFDRRVTILEFRQAVPLLNHWGINVTDPDALFKEIDRDGQGMILFDEFCSWASKKSLDIEK